MDETQIRLLIVLLFLVFGSTLVTLIKKFRTRIFTPTVPVFQMIIRQAGQDTITLENLIMIIPAHIISGAASAAGRIEQIPRITSKTVQQAADEFYRGQENKAFAAAAIQTYRAWQNGLMLKVVDPEGTLSENEQKNLVPDDSITGFNDFVLYSFLGVQNSDRMPVTMKQLQRQYMIFFREYPIDGNEFILAWSLGAMLTSRTLLIFNIESEPEISSIIPLSGIKDVKISETGTRKIA